MHFTSRTFRLLCVALGLLLTAQVAGLTRNEFFVTCIFGTLRFVLLPCGGPMLWYVEGAPSPLPIVNKLVAKEIPWTPGGGY
jgi:hypothetical protein